MIRAQKWGPGSVCPLVNPICSLIIMLKTAVSFRRSITKNFKYYDTTDIIQSFLEWNFCIPLQFSEVESSRTALASRTSSRTHFEVLGLEASNPRKLPCPRLEDSTNFEPLKFRWKTSETLRKICKDLFLVSSSRDCLKKNFWRLFSPEKNFWRPYFFEIAWKKILRTFFFGEHLRLCPWPREGLSLALKFFCVLGLEFCVLDSTSGSSSVFFTHVKKFGEHSKYFYILQYVVINFYQLLKIMHLLWR